MRRRILALGGAAVLAVTGCSGGAHHTSTPSTRPPSATTTAPDPDVVPNRITPAYVDAVFAKLNHIYGNAVRSEIETHSVNQTVKTDLRSIYNDPQYAEEVEVFTQGLEEGLPKLRPDPGDPIITVRKLKASSPNCIFVSVQTDLSQVVATSTPSAPSEYYVLKMKQAHIDPRRLNSTPWAISLNVSYTHPTPVANQCAA